MKHSPPAPPSRHSTEHRPTARQSTLIVEPSPTSEASLGDSSHLQPHINRSTLSLLRAFRCAFAGVWYLFRTQRNAQIHLLISACVIALGLVLGLARWEWLVLVLTIALVLAAEGINTAIEAAVDLATSTYHPLARVAKDVAAGAVVICALAAITVGCLVFIPHLWPLLQRLLALSL